MPEATTKYLVMYHTYGFNPGSLRINGLQLGQTDNSLLPFGIIDEKAQVELISLGNWHAVYT